MAVSFISKASINYMPSTYTINFTWLKYRQNSTKYDISHKPYAHKFKDLAALLLRLSCGQIDRFGREEVELFIAEN
jgi:hypothetical protein